MGTEVRVLDKVRGPLLVGTLQKTMPEVLKEIPGIVSARMLTGKSRLKIKTEASPGHALCRNYKRSMRGIVGAMSWKTLARKMAMAEGADKEEAS